VKKKTGWIIYFLLAIVATPLIFHLLTTQDYVSIFAVALTVCAGGYLINNAFRKKNIE
jgi:hypothetical protein